MLHVGELSQIAHGGLSLPLMLLLLLLLLLSLLLQLLLLLLMLCCCCCCCCFGRGIFYRLLHRHLLS